MKRDLFLEHCKISMVSDTRSRKDGKCDMYMVFEIKLELVIGTFFDY